MDWFYAGAGVFYANCRELFVNFVLTANDSNLTRLRRSIRGLITRMLMLVVKIFSGKC